MQPEMSPDDYEAKLLRLAQTASEEWLQKMEGEYPQVVFEVRAKKLELMNLPPAQHKVKLMELIQLEARRRAPQP